MFENIANFFRNIGQKDLSKVSHSKETAKERLHLVLMQDRANVSVDFLELMKQEIIDVIKKYIQIDENEIDVRLTNKENSDGTNGAPALYANIPIVNLKNEDINEVVNKAKNENLEKLEEAKVNKKTTKEVVNDEKETVKDVKESTKKEVKKKETDKSDKPEIKDEKTVKKK